MSRQKDYLSWKFDLDESVSEYFWIVSLNLQWCSQEKSDVDDQLNNFKDLREFRYLVTSFFAWLGFTNPKADKHKNSFLCSSAIYSIWQILLTPSCYVTPPPPSSS